MPKPLPPPGTPEARRMYCTCIALSDLAHALKEAAESTNPEPFNELYWQVLQRLDCPLHGNNPQYDLPEGL